MTGLLRRLATALRNRRRARAEWAMRELKVRYHTFRILLDNNERALELINVLEAVLAAGPEGVEAEGPAMVDQVEELLAVTYELTDGLNRLSGGGHGALYGLHSRLSQTVGQAMAEMKATAADGPSCVFLDHLTPAMAAQAGGKAANLAALRRAGLPVPDGFCVPAFVCRRFLDRAGLTRKIRRILNDLGDDADNGRIDEVSTAVAEMVLAAPLPGELARDLGEAFDRLAGHDGATVSARSSALVEDRPGASFAGQFTSKLNLTTAGALLDAYKAIVAANFGPRPLAYRLHLGLPPADFGMAVLVQRMVPARAAGVLFTVDPARPGDGRMLVSAVPGLGTLAVGGEAPADVYHPSRDDTADVEPNVARKTVRQIMDPDGGLVLEDVPEAERDLPVLDPGQVAELARLGLRSESLLGGPQDLEWGLDAEGGLHVLQSRPLHVAARSAGATASRRGSMLLEGGVCASPGRSVGRVHVVRGREDLPGRDDVDAPLVLVMHQSLVDAARRLPGQAGVVVDLGNPADHLSSVARELGVPMLTGTGRATEVLEHGRWVVLDADRVEVLEAPQEAWEDAASRPGRAARPPADIAVQALPPGLQRLHEFVVPLHLTDAYGPTFSMAECSSLHDLVRFIHEKAVLTMFDAGDEIMDEAGVLLRRLVVDLPLHFLLIDVGGGIVPDSTGRDVRPVEVISAPFQALFQGLTTPGLRWKAPPALTSPGGLFSRSLLDARGARPVGSFNYGLVSRDYMNLNARLDFHFVLIDAVCGPNTRENAIRFRFKGGGTSQVQRERRARCVALILRAHDFMADQRGDLVTASLTGAGQDDVAERLAVLGRLLGFSRLLDAAMTDDDMPERMAQAFQDGDYGLEELLAENAAD